MSRKRTHKEVKTPRKVAIRRSACKGHRNKYAAFSKQPHNSYGVKQ